MLTMIPQFCLAVAFISALFPSSVAQTIKLEAEDGVLTGVTATTDTAGFSGTGYVSGFDDASDTVAVSVTVNATTLYDLSIAYNAPYGDKKTYISLNGVSAGEAALVSTTTWTNVSAGRLLLNAGNNTIALQDDWGYYEIDYFLLSPTSPPAPHEDNASPVNPNATAKAKSLLKYIQQHYGTDVISGQQDISAIQWIEDNVGVAPAIAGLDFIEYSPSRVEHGSTSNATEEAIAWDTRGGITAFVWHWNAPTDLIDQPGEEWWRGFYTEATTFNISSALADPNGDDYALVLRDLDAIAVQIARLSNASIPLLWRPLHEAEGGWFWWGAQGPEAAKTLYRLMYDRFTNVHQLNNLIWVWNSVSSDWYPGDDIVDILSYDSYPATGDHGPVSSQFDSLISLGQDKKPIALAEVGEIPDPSLMRAYYSNWAYFVTWGGDYIINSTHNALDYVKQVYTDPHVITLDTVGDFKHVA